MVRLIKEINPGGSSLPSWFTVLGPWLYFAADDGAGAGWGNHELWRSDGTEAGTALVKEIAPPPARASNPGQQTHAAFQGNVYFSASNGVSEPLWRSDGTASGTFIVNIAFSSVVPNSLTEAGGRLYISFGGGAPDSYLYRYDGIDLAPIRRSTNPWEWGFNPFEPTALGRNLYFTENSGNELWRTDGSSSIAVAVPDPALPPAELPRSKRHLTAVGDTLFFAAAAGSAGGKELWTYRAGEPTTAKVAFIGTGYDPAELTAVGNRLFFVGDDSRGAELWISDGTAAGTTLVRDINPTAGAGAPGPRRGPSQLTAVSDRAVYFAANDGSSGYELWRSDGTADGTQRLLDINPGAASSHPRDLIVRGNLLYFTASDDTNGRQLWATDTLTNATTRLTSRSMLGPSSQFFVQNRGNDPNLAIAGNTLFLSAYSSDGAAVSGYELWGLDLPSIVSLSLPSDAVPRQLSEDGPRVLPIVFRRGGDTSSALTVNFRVGGKARLGIDYTLRGAASLSPTGGSITIAAGASTATLLLDPSSDTLTEDNETVVVALLSTADYAMDGTSSDLVVTLIDNDVPAGQVAGAPIPSVLASSSAFETRNAFAFAALKAGGSVVAWGDANSGGDISAVATQLASDVTRIASTSSAFAALKADGSVVPWGNALFGGDAGAVASQLTGDVRQIVATGFAFAALKRDGSVITWGDSRFGNLGGDSSAVRSQLAADVRQVFAGPRAFAALKTDGSVVAWGDLNSGGSTAAVGAGLNAGVVAITAGGSAFAALKADGSVVAWGDPAKGGSLSPTLAAQLSGGVVQIFANNDAFAALKDDGSVIPWGDAAYGGSISPTVAGLLSSGVRQVAATYFSFAALTADGSVVTWGGDYDESRGFGISDPSVALKLASGVTRLFATNQVFAALKSDGSVVAWGNPLIGGDTGAAQAQLNSGVIDIVTSDDAFAALKADGSVITWGWAASGGNSSAVASQLRSCVTSVTSNGRAFAALKSDGSVITWGDGSLGGNSSTVASQLSDGVVAFASPFRDDRLSFQPAALTSFATIEAQGNTRLLHRGDGVAFALAGSGPRLEITSPWGSGAGNDASEWQMVAAETISGIHRVLWRNNSANFLHTWGLDGEWNWQASGGIDGFNTPRAWALEVDFQVDANRDGFIGIPYTTLEAQGNTKLVGRGDGKPFAEDGAGSRQEITSPWGAPVGSDSIEWQMLAAETIGGVNRLLWRNNTANFLHTWRLDANWSFSAASGVDGFNTPRAWALEVDFQVDANRDGIIGIPYTTLEAQGNTKLVGRGDGKPFAEDGAGSRHEITSPWGAPTGSESTEWQMLAAETIGGVNRLLWRNNTANFLHTWGLDANWSWTSASGADGFNTPRAWALEVDFQVDANRDGIIGTPYTTIESQGNIKMLRRGDGKAFAEDGAGTRQEITSPWDAPTGSESTEWQMLAAETIGGVNRLLWRNNTSNFLHTWGLDANWNWTSASGADGINTPRAWALEVDFQVDANRDGIIGPPL